ncbi:hypothetical protein ACFWOJ_37975 [Streptomyces sp. NPDC058439]
MSSLVELGQFVLNVLGRYSFTASVPREGLRPLRDPDAVELDDDDGARED